MTESAKRREDIFVSIGIIGSNGKWAESDHLPNLVAWMNGQFRYWELLYVVNADHASLNGLLSLTSNMRLIKVRSDTPNYRRRLCIAEEAIGDLLILTCPEELEYLQIGTLIAEAEETGSLITTRRSGSEFSNTWLVALGRSAGFRANSRDLVTTAIPRPILSRLLRHPNVALAVRFPPIDRNIPVKVQISQDAPPRPWYGSFGLISYRLRLVHQIIVSSASKVLGLIEMLSILVSLCALAYALYAVLIWSTKVDVQPGWFTTTLLLSLTALFLGFAIFGISIGLQRLLAVSVGVRDEDIIEEVNTIDMFGSVKQELNIEFDAAHGQKSPGNLTS